MDEVVLEEFVANVRHDGMNVFGSGHDDGNKDELGELFTLRSTRPTINRLKY